MKPVNPLIIKSEIDELNRRRQRQKLKSKLEDLEILGNGTKFLNCKNLPQNFKIKSKEPSNQSSSHSVRTRDMSSKSWGEKNNRY